MGSKAGCGGSGSVTIRNSERALNRLELPAQAVVILDWHASIRDSAIVVHRPR